MLTSGADYDAPKATADLLRPRQRGPDEGIGKPEQLRHLLAGTWSLRIGEGHRLVHLVDGDCLVILGTDFTTNIPEQPQLSFRGECRRDRPGARPSR